MIDWPQEIIEDWAGLQKALEPIAGPCVFRGQCNRNWKLESSMGRMIRGADESLALALEREAIMEFRSQAHLYLEPSVVPPNPYNLDALDTYLEWLMLMQHYGAPTRGALHGQEENANGPGNRAARRFHVSEPPVGRPPGGDR